MQREREQTGYIFKRGNWWMLRYREGVIENGQAVRRQVAKRVERIQDEHKRLKRPPESVKDAAEVVLRAVNSEVYKPEANQTLVDYVEKKFFPDQEHQVRRSTWTGYKRRWAFVKPYCPDVRLREFKTSDGTSILNKIARSNPHLLHSTLQHFKTLLSAFFTYAISQGILDGEVTVNGTRKNVFGNPMRSVKVPTDAPQGEDTYAYSTDEVRSILLHLGQPARAIVAVAAYAGLRRSEIAGLEWENYDGKQLNVTRSIWEGHVSKPKTKASKAPVPVITALRNILDMHRLESGNPKTGPMFRSQAKARTPLNMNNVLNRMILPVLNSCEICQKGKKEHTGTDHKYKRYASLPEWHGWHAFRRGLATNLHDLGVDDKTIQAILRHENVSMTQRCYIKTLPKQTIAAMNQLDESVSKLASENSLSCTDCAPLCTTNLSKLLN